MKTDALKRVHEDEKYFPAGRQPNRVIASIFGNYVKRPSEIVLILAIQAAKARAAAHRTRLVAEVTRTARRWSMRTVLFMLLHCWSSI